MAESSEAKVAVKLSILTKTGEVLALCYTTDCTEAEPSVKTLLQIGYNEVNPVPKPVEAQAANSQLLFFIQAESDIEVLPTVQTLSIQLIKPGSPHQIRFKCYSASGENTTVQLVIKDGGDVVDQEDFDVTCKKKDIKNAAGSSKAALISGGSGGNLNLAGANVKVVGTERNSHYIVNTFILYQQTTNQATSSSATTSGEEAPVDTPAHQQTSNQAANSPAMSSRSEAKASVKLTILTKTGEVLALCYTADCTEAKQSLATLLQEGYDKFNVTPKPIEARTADSELQLSIKAESDVEIRPPVRTLRIHLIKPGSPHEMRFKCYSATGENATVQLVTKVRGDLVSRDDIDVTCKKKVRSAAAPDTSANQQSANQVANSPSTSSGNESPSFFRRIVLGGRHLRKFIKVVNDLSYSNSCGGITDGYDEHNLCEPDKEVYCRMKMPIRFYSGELVRDEPFTSDYTRERMCCPNAGPLKESKMISPEQLKKLISATQEKTRFVAVLGMAGSGKSTLIKRLVRDIILPERKKRRVFSDPRYGRRFKLVRFLNIKDIVQATYPVNACEVLFSRGTLPKLGTNDIHFGYKWAVNHESEVLFALDGLDQASWVLPTDFPKIGYTEKAPVGVVIANILSGNLFKGSKILLTSREHSVASLCGSLRPKTIITMVGLDLKDVEKVFNSLISFINKDKDGVFQTLSPGIIPLCSIPLFLVYCAVIFIVNPDLHPNTMSAVLHEILRIFLHSKHSQIPLEGEVKKRIISFFKSISLRAILEMRVTFTWPEFRKGGITPKMLSQFTMKVPGPSILSQKMFDEDYKVFFNHQTLQEKFASMEICEKESSNFRSFAFNELRQPHLSVVRRFVCGLLSVLGKNSEFVAIKDREEKWSIFKETLRQQAENSTSSDEQIELLALLYESQDQELIQSVVAKIDFTDVIFTPATAHAMATILTSCRQLRLFQLKNCQLDEECLDILDRVTYKAKLQVEVVQLDARLFRPGCFIENMQPRLLILLSDSSSGSPTLLLSSGLSNCPLVAVVVDAISRKVISFFFPLANGEEPVVLPASHEIIVPDPMDNPNPVDVIAIEGPSTCLLRLEKFIKYLRPKVFVALLTDDTKYSQMQQKWSLDKTCVMAYKVNLDEYYELISSPFGQGAILPHDVEILTMVPNWSLDDTCLSLKGNLGLYFKQLSSSPFCQEAIVPRGYQEQIVSVLKERITKVDIVVIEGTFMCLLKLENFVKYLRPKILILLVTDRSDNWSEAQKWSLDQTCIVVLRANVGEYCELLISSPFCQETRIPGGYRETIAATLKKRVQTLDVVILEGSVSHLVRLENFMKYIQPKVLILLSPDLATDVAEVRSAVSNWSSVETCVMAFQVDRGKCKLLGLSPFCQKTVIPDGYEEKIVSAIKGRIQKIELLDVSHNPELCRNNGLKVVGSTVAQCNVGKVKMGWCNIAGSHMKDFANGAGNTKVKHLDVSTNPELRDNNGFVAVGSTVAQCKVEEVSMSWCKMEASHMKDFGKGAANAKVKKLDVSDNPELRDNNGFVAVGSTVAQCKVEEVLMTWCYMEASHMKDFEKGAENAKVRRLDVSMNPELRNNNGFVALGLTVAQCKIEEVVMKGCKTEASHMKDFAKGAGNAKIRKLDLSWNEVNSRYFESCLGEEGLTEITRIVRRNKVEELIMEGCEFGPTQLERFKKSIPGVKFTY